MLTVITGASSGIGTETTHVLALHGVHVIMGVRSMAAGREAKDAILKEIPTVKVDVMELDLCSSASVRKFVSDFNKHDLLLNILMNCWNPIQAFQRNIELHFATNHLSHFLLCNLSLDIMKKTAWESGREGRIVIVSSGAYRMTYHEGIHFDRINDKSGCSILGAYAESKLDNILHANELARHLKEDGESEYCKFTSPRSNCHQNFHHVSFINGLINLVGKYVIKNVQQGAATTCYVALNSQVEGKWDLYFSDSNIAQLKPQAVNTEFAQKLSDISLD